MEQSPSSEGNSYPQHSVESKGSVTGSQERTTGPYLKPVYSIYTLSPFPLRLHFNINILHIYSLVSAKYSLIY